MRLLALGLLLLAGCGGKEPERGSAQSPTVRDADADSMPEMPPYPNVERGRIAMQSAGPAGSQEITGDWPAQAGTCEQPPMLQLVAQEQGFGVIVLLAVPPGNRTTTYPVTIVSGGLPTPPAAQVGVNMFRPVGSFAYQAADGTVELYALDRVVSGRFAVTLREINRNQRLRLAGAFREVRVKSLAGEMCRMVDSAAAAR